MNALRELISQDSTPTAVRARQTAFGLLALWAIPLLITLIYAVFAKHDVHLSHDEAEHLHVVFALERGERPYRDFLENHPLLPHVLVSGLSRGLGLGTSANVYLVAKMVVLAHFLGCLVLLLSWLGKYREQLDLRLSPVLTVPLVAALLGVWQPTGELSRSFAYLWEVRPDWTCHFWTLAALMLAVEALRWRSTGTACLLSAVGGLCAGFAVALMAKSVLLLLPAALALILTAIRWSRVHPEGVRRLLGALGLAGCFLAAGAAMFAAGVAGELAATGATWHEYAAANFALNSQKHLVAVTEDLAPANVLRGISGLSFAAALVATVLGFAMTGHARRKQLWLRYGVLAFVGIQLLFSMCLPAFSNGLSWPQYFMPAMLTMLLIFVLMLDRLAAAAFETHLVPRLNAGRLARTSIRCAPALVLMVMLLGLLMQRTLDAQIRRQDLQSHAKQSHTAHQGVSHGLPDAMLPDDLTYLIFSPERKPVRARAWGHYFMLVRDRNLWRDNHALGLGPDPQTHWRQLYTRQPPDAVLVNDTRELRDFIRIASRMQGVNLVWLDEAVRRDYACLTRTSVALHVRHALVERFTGLGFKPCHTNLEKPEWL